MNKHRLLSLLIVLITNLSCLSGQSVSVKVSRNDTFTNIVTAQQELTFREYLELGYEDLKTQNYQQALNNFNAALKLSPDNREVQQAIIRTQGYIYDENMDKGYEATNNREYEQALNYFRLAAQQRPDDFYSQQAINNVEKLQEKLNQNDSNPIPTKSPLLILVIFILILLIIIIIALIFLALRIVRFNQMSVQESEGLEQQKESISIPQSGSIPLSSASKSGSQLNKSVNEALEKQLEQNNYLPASLTLISPSSSSNHEYTLSTTKATVLGRSPECNIVLNRHEFAVVSRFHARIELLETNNQVKWQITDNNSTNGTLVNGETITSPRFLQSGDRIRLGLKGPEFIFETETLNPTIFFDIENESDTSLQESKEKKQYPQHQNSDISQSSLARQDQDNLIDKKDKILQSILELEQANANQRAKIIWNLASEGDSRAIQPLVNLMITANSQEKSLIVEALAQIAVKNNKSINQALIIALQDQHEQVRKNAFREITKIYELAIQFQPVFTHAALNDPDPEVREIAQWALNEISQEAKMLPEEQDQSAHTVTFYPISPQSES